MAPFFLLHPPRNRLLTATGCPSRSAPLIQCRRGGRYVIRPRRIQRVPFRRREDCVATLSFFAGCRGEARCWTGAKQPNEAEPFPCRPLTHTAAIFGILG